MKGYPDPGEGRGGERVGERREVRGKQEDIHH